jgi:hypothetical protein
MNDFAQDDIDFVLDLFANACGVKPNSSAFMNDEERERVRFIQRFPINQVPGRDIVTKAVRTVKLFKLAKHYEYLYYQYSYGFDLLAWLIGVMDKMPRIDVSGMALLLCLAGGDEDGEDNGTQLGLEIAASQGIDLEEMLRIARQLDETQAFQSPQGELTPDFNGEDVTVRTMEELGELPRVSQQFWGLPSVYGDYKLVTGDLDVRQPVTRHDKKQLLYMLVDGTGSMRGTPINRAVGVVINALERVIKGEAEVYLRFFDTRLGEQEYHADSPETARELLKVVTDPANYSGGGTNFVEPLRVATDRVNDLVRQGKFRLPEIVMVTDGAAPIPSVSDLRDLKLNVVQVGEYGLVENLAKLAEASGGVNIDATTKRSEN